MNTSHKTTTREKINRILNERMPGFATSFFRARNNSMTELSLYAYALDISLFFDYLEDVKGIPVREITIRDFENITKEEIENYIDYSRIIKVNGFDTERSNSALRRRFTTINVFYNYFYSEGFIDKIPTLRVKKPMEQLRLPSIPSEDDCIALIDFISNGNLTKNKEAAYQDRFRERDSAIVTLLCFAGLKPAECVNLNVDDIHIDEHFINVSGRLQPHVITSTYIEQSLSKYLNIRLNSMAFYGHDEALFLALTGRRILQRSLEYMIKKYTTALFGEEKRIVANNLTLFYKNYVFNNTKSIEKTATLTGSKPYQTFRQNKAAIDELIADTRNIDCIKATNPPITLLI